MGTEVQRKWFMFREVSLIDPKIYFFKKKEKEKERHAGKDGRDRLIRYF